MLDFAKALDSVSHKRLFAKLKAYGINDLVLKWMEAFLNNRRQRIDLGEVFFEWLESFSGVPQGSFIGPLMFIIYIYYLRSKLVNKCKLFADDTKTLSKVISDECTSSLQRDLNKSFKWTEDLLLKFNVDKRVVMHRLNRLGFSVMKAD
ncbi:uncharacterized protein LOC136078726 [Hydra vulgaris]|uniref:Uncharacterized protein LOC136078726 n=1 Tax=Hydra vulgaris TaxID=6087 RepID=A0ABM4BND5_HYDVU